MLPEETVQIELTDLEEEEQELVISSEPIRLNPVIVKPPVRKTEPQYLLQEFGDYERDGVINYEFFVFRLNADPADCLQVAKRGSKLAFDYINLFIKEGRISSSFFADLGLNVEDYYKPGTTEVARVSRDFITRLFMDWLKKYNAGLEIELVKFHFNNDPIPVNGVNWPNKIETEVIETNKKGKKNADSNARSRYF